MKVTLLAALRGNIIVYQGEELGLTQVEIPFEQLQDPEAIANWPLTLARDGARTPLPWQAQSEQGGFTASSAPWLPLGEENMARAVDRQENDPASLLNLTRSLLALRHQTPALRNGACDVVLADATRLVLRRTSDDDSVLAVFNISAADAGWPEGLSTAGTSIFAVGGAEPGRLPAFGAVLIRESK